MKEIRDGNERTGKTSPLINREQGRDGKGALSQATVKTDAGRVVRKVKVGHHLIYVGKDLGEGNGVDKTDETKTYQLGFWKRSRCRLKFGRRGEYLGL